MAKCLTSSRSFVALTTLLPIVASISLCASTARSSTQSPQHPTIPIRPLVTIGDDSGNLKYNFGAIGSISTSADGRVFVLDELECNVKVFSAAGAYITTFGRPGAGPGEFVAGAGISVDGDTVRIHDGRQNRTVVFTLDGKHVRTQSLPGFADDNTVMRGSRLRNGFIYLARSAVVAPGRTPLYDPFLYVTVRGPVGSAERILAKIRLDAVLVTPRDPEDARAVQTGFGSGGAAVRSGDSLIVTVDGYSGAVRWFAITVNGPSLIKTDSLLRAPVPVTRADMRAVETRVSQEPRWRGFGVLSFSGAPEYWSLANRVIVGRDGAVWTGAVDPRKGLFVWTSFPVRGTPFHVEVPKDFRLLFADRDKLYGETRTSLDAPVVRVYQLERR